MLAFCGGGGKNNLGQQSFLAGIIWHIFGDSYSFDYAQDMRSFVKKNEKTLD